MPQQKEFPEPSGETPAQTQQSPDISVSTSAEGSLPDAEAEAPVGETVVASEEVSQPAEASINRKTADPEEQDAASLSSENQRLAQAFGHGIWLALAIGAAGLILTLFLPWAQVYYLNPLQPLKFDENGAIQFTRDEVVHVGLRGFQLLTLHLVPLLIVVLAVILLLGTTIYWHQAHFLDRHISLLVLCLGLLVGLGFPVELLTLLSTSQRVEWSNSHATIEPNSGIHDFSAKDGTLYLCTPQSRLDTSCNNDYSNGIILNAGIDWVEINGSTGEPIIQGHAQSTRPSFTSSDVTSSGYALGPLGFMNPSIGYWGAWSLSVWTLLSTLAFANRLRKTGKKQTNKHSFIP